MYIKKALRGAALAILISAAICTAAAAEWKFDKKITVVCPWGLGGGADTTIRKFAVMLNRVLDVEVEVVNVTGASGVYGAEYAHEQPADGYTFLLGTQSLIMQDLEGAMTTDFKTEFVPVVKLMHSVNIIAGSRKALREKGCRDFSALVAYAKENPGLVRAGMLSSTGVDGVSLRQTLTGLDVTILPFSSGEEMIAAIVEGEADIMVTGISEISKYIQSGDIVPICAIAKKRLKVYPDLQCTADLGIESYMGPWRGLFAKRGTPDEAIEALAIAAEKASTLPAWKDFLRMSSYDERTGFAPREEFTALVADEYTALADFLESEGVLKKTY